MSTTDETHPDIPEQSWENPFAEGTPLDNLYDRRVRQNSDLVVVVSDWHNRRGTGKTVASLKLAQALDRTDEGITKGKVSLSPEEIRESYAEQPKGSALVLDEAEAGISNRSAMSNVNKTMRKIMSMGRIEEKYLVLNAPASSHIDKSVKELADVWVLVQRKGRALVHFLEYQPYSNKALTRKEQSFEWDDIERGTHLREVYNYLTKEKQGRIRGEEGGGYIERKEHEKKLEKQEKKLRKEIRDDVLRSIATHPEHEASDDVTNRSLGEAVDLAPGSVSKIINHGENH
jgi:hypothetical protein